RRAAEGHLGDKLVPSTSDHDDETERRTAYNWIIPELGGDGSPQRLLVRAARNDGVDPVIELDGDMGGRVRGARRGDSEQGDRGEVNKATPRRGHGGSMIALRPRPHGLPQLSMAVTGTPRKPVGVTAARQLPVGYDAGSLAPMNILLTRPDVAL